MLRAICGQHFAAVYELEIVDMLRYQKRALADKIIVTPIDLAPRQGFTTEEMIGTSLFQFVPEAAEAVLRIEHSQQRISEENEVAYVPTDSSRLWTLLKTNPLLDSDQKWHGTLGMIDRTHRRVAEAALRESTAELVESEALFRLAETVQEVFFLTDPPMKRCPLSWGDGIHPYGREGAFAEIMPHATIVPFDVEYRRVRPDAALCRAAGMDAYLSKPMETNELFDLIERLCRENCGQMGSRE